MYPRSFSFINISRLKRKGEIDKEKTSNKKHARRQRRAALPRLDPSRGGRGYKHTPTTSFVFDHLKSNTAAHPRKTAREPHKTK